MMASLQPACHTKKFSNDYVLSVKLSYDGNDCCVNLPDAKMPMTIVPMVNPALLGGTPGVGFHDFRPTELGNFHVDIIDEGSSD